MLTIKKRAVVFSSITVLMKIVTSRESLDEIKVALAFKMEVKMR